MDKSSTSYKALNALLLIALFWAQAVLLYLFPLAVTGTALAVGLFVPIYKMRSVLVKFTAGAVDAADNLGSKGQARADLVAKLGEKYAGNPVTLKVVPSNPEASGGTVDANMVGKRTLYLTQEAFNLPLDAFRAFASYEIQLQMSKRLRALKGFLLLRAVVIFIARLWLIAMLGGPDISLVAALVITAFATCVSRAFLTSTLPAVTRAAAGLDQRVLKNEGPALIEALKISHKSIPEGPMADMLTERLERLEKISH